MKTNNRKTYQIARIHPGFSLVELLVAISVFSVILIIVIQVMNQMQIVGQQVRGNVSQFKEARTAFDTIVQRLSQATLNTYWDYDDPNKPSAYEPDSQHHFLSGKASKLVRKSSGDPVGHAIFFQAPLGFSPQAEYRDFQNLINAWGYYVEFGSGEEHLPDFVKSHPNYQAKFRHRLMEFRQPTEKLGLYKEYQEQWEKTNKTKDKIKLENWYQDDDPNHNRIVAENIPLLVFEPMYPDAELGESRNLLAPNYEFDSRTNKQMKHELPPMVRVTMVAIAENSADQRGFSAGDAELFPNGLFGDALQYKDDIEKVKEILAKENLDGRVFSTIVPIRAAYWTNPNIPN